MKLLVSTIFLVILWGCQTQYENKNEKLSDSEHLVMSTAWFQKSAEMRACYYQTYNLAKMRLKQQVDNYKGEKPIAVVLDIDETVLDNSPYETYLIQNNALYSSETWKLWTDKGEAIPLPGALEFTIFAKQLGVQVFYISNRKTNMLESTLKNMSNIGFPNVEKQFVFLRDINKSSDKTERRNEVSKKFEILMLIGDNLTDFSQIYAERGDDLGFELTDSCKDSFGDKFIILPNPMYGEWEGALYKNDYSNSKEKKRAMRKEILKGF